jgi:hypothetical protein
VEKGQRWVAFSAHAFGDAVKIRTFYDDLIATGHDLDVLPLMESYADAVGGVGHSAQERELSCPAKLVV